MPGSEFHNTSARGHFGDSLAALDWSVGRVLDTLANSGVRKNSSTEIILF